MTPRTLYDKIWDAHVVEHRPDGTVLLYIDRHLIHEVTSPQAFEGLKLAGRKPRAPKRALAVADHNVPTQNRHAGIADPESRLQVETLQKNCRKFGIEFFPLDDTRQGIVHIVGPEQGFTLPGTTLVCGDSHTSTHGAFGALAYGIGTSEVEHVLATQTLVQKKSKNFKIVLRGTPPPHVTPKDVVLAIIGHIGADGGTGYVLEYTGEVIDALSMEGRMTICNMSIEAGARAGLCAPDFKTFDYLKEKPRAPKQWDKAVAQWKKLRSDTDAEFDKEATLNVENLPPLVTWGTSPQDVAAVTSTVPDPQKIENPDKRAAMERSLSYMDLVPGTPITRIPIDRVFIGSCTNGRIEDLRAAAAVAKGGKVAPHVDAMVVPGSGLVKAQAEAEGLHTLFIKAGFQWRDPGCSMCLAMNDDKLKEGQRCASTSNRNFEGRQGRGGRTHLVSPAMAAAAALAGRFVDVRNF